MFITRDEAKEITFTVIMIKNITGIIETDMKPGILVTFDPPVGELESFFSLVGLKAKFNNEQKLINYMAGKLDPDGRICLIFDKAYSDVINLGCEMKLF